MLKESTITINISYRNVTHYKKLGYSAVIGNSLEIKTLHLTTVSHVKVDVVCELCGKEQSLMYCKYISNIKRHGFYGCRSCSRQKAALTSIEKYGVDNYSKTKEWKQRVEKTNIRKFGFKTNLLNPAFKERIKNILMEKYGKENFYEIRRPSGKNKLKISATSNIPSIVDFESIYIDIHFESYKAYRNECRRITESNCKILFDDWDGKDYYDDEDISQNFSLDVNDPEYPTIDHKISIYYGYINLIDPESIGSLENICVTKRSINSRKNSLTLDEFKSVFNQQNPAQMI